MSKKKKNGNDFNNMSKNNINDNRSNNINKKDVDNNNSNNNFNDNSQKNNTIKVNNSNNSKKDGKEKIENYNNSEKDEKRESEKRHIENINQGNRIKNDNSNNKLEKNNKANKNNKTGSNENQGKNYKNNEISLNENKVKSNKNNKSGTNESHDNSNKNNKMGSNENYTKDKMNYINDEKNNPPTLMEKEEQRKKKNLFLLIILIIIVIIILVFSVIFALINVTKSVIVNGVSVKNIIVSNLTITEAKEKLTEAFNIELNSPIKLVAKNYETTLNSNQIEFSYDVSKIAEDAYSYGRDGNIFENNYSILKGMLFGKQIELNYSYNKDTLNYIVDDIESKIPGLVTEATYYREGNELIIIPGKDGIRVDKERLKEEIINTILSINAEDILENKVKLEINIPIEDAKSKEIDIDKIYSEVYTEPIDAYYEPEPFKIYAETEGVDFSISKEEAKNIISEKKEEYRIPLTITPASKTINDIGLEAFPYLISEFSTKYDASNKNRSQNLAIAAGKIDGTVLMPGEEFSFNQIVGKRTIEEGYKDAKIYQDGQVVDGLAGGICQISSTLYNAVVKANLEIVERRNHSFTTSYIRAGQDATVVYGVIDFKFKNTRTYPIKISASVNSGIAEFKINGIKEEVEYDISLYPVTTGSIPYTTQYIPDPSLAPGQQAVVQGGANGLKVTTYKDTKLDGKLISREVMSTDTYSPMKAIIRVGQ